MDTTDRIDRRTRPPTARRDDPPAPHQVVVADTVQPPEPARAAQDRLVAFDGMRVAALSAPAETVSPERRTAIEAFARDNADAARTFLGIRIDSTGGTVIGAAMTGASGLGPLTAPEQRLLADRTVATLQTTRNTEVVSELTDAVRNDPAARRAVAGALAAPEAEAQRHFATGGQYLEAPGSSGFRATLRDAALGLDAAETLRTNHGAETQLGKAATGQPPAVQAALLRAAADGAVPADAADRLATSMFVHGSGDSIAGNADLRRAMADALAAGMRPGAGQPDASARTLIADRLDAAMATEDGRNLLFGEQVMPDARAWALGEIAANPAFTPEALRGGWESGTVAQTFAARVAEPYAARGTEPVSLRGEALRNTVGQGLRIGPDLLPPAGETPEAAQARMQAGIDHRYYGPNPQIDAVAGRIRELGGDDARVTVVPVTVTSNDFGAATYAVFRVEGADGQSRFVDHDGLRYDSLQDWTTGNRLPQGQMTFPAGMRPGAALETRATPGVIDTFSERAGQIGDGVAMAAGIVAGVVIIVGSGGTAAPVVAGVAGAYFTGRAGASLADDQRRGIDIADLSNADVRAKWLDVAAGSLSLGAIGAAVRTARTAQVGVTAARTVAGLQVAANTADAVAVTNQSVALARDWDRMTPGDRAAGLLNIAFWGGMTAASTRAGGGALTDAYSFTRLENNIRFGSPYPVAANERMEPGAIRVAYDTDGGRARGIRIEHGPGTPDRAMLDLHTRTAQQMEASGGLQDRLGVMLTGRAAPEPGSAAWEARIEIGKIGSEARTLAADLATPGLTPERRAALETRQRELDQAIVREGARLDAGAAAGDGFVAAPRSLNDILTAYAANGAIQRGLPDGIAAPATPARTDVGRINLGRVNAQGQAQGIDATITRAQLDTGTSASNRIGPPGYLHGDYNHSRGHLLGRVLGGRGDDPRNLVMLFQGDTNAPVMSSFEAAVYRAVDAGEVVNYRVTPIYETNGRPVALAISARGSDGLDFDITLVNRDGSNGMGR